MADDAQTTTKKHRQFASEPIGEKLVTDLAGIGEVAGKKLTDEGFAKAYKVLGQFLVLEKDQELFVDWLMKTAGANIGNATKCYNCLKDWSDTFI